MKVRESFLKETLECVRHEHAALAKVISKILEGAPIDRPPFANDGYEDYYWVQLTDAQISDIASTFLDFEAAAIADDGSTTPEASHFGSMVDFWRSNLRED